MQTLKSREIILKKLIKTKAKNIVSINVKKKSDITDYMIICTGKSNRHLISIADRIIKTCSKNKISYLGIEGKGISSWIVIDFYEIIVHIMKKETRDLYELEKLWG